MPWTGASDENVLNCLRIETLALQPGWSAMATTAWPLSCAATRRAFARKAS